MDNKNNEPIVLGELKKEKSSKPIFVLIVFLLLIGTCFGLPYIGEYMNNNDNVVTRLYKQLFGDNDIVDTPVIPSDKDESKGLSLLNENTNMQFEGINIKRVILKTNQVNYVMNSIKDINLDEGKYYLEIYGSSLNLLTRVKLTGTATKNQVGVQSAFVLNINESSKYYGKITKLEVESYPDSKVTSGALTCVNADNTYVYNFENGALKIINHTYTNRDVSDINKYMESLNKSNMKSNLINTFTNCTSSTIEESTGYKFNATLTLDNIKKTDLKEYIDYNYYDLNTTPKEVEYELTTKGYTCS